VRVTFTSSSTGAIKDLPHGWVPIGKRRWNSAWAVTSGVVTAFLFWSSINFSILLGQLLKVTPFLIGAIGLVAAVPVVVIATLVRNRRWPQPGVNLDTSELRAGAKVVALGDVDSATLVVFPTRKTRVVLLRIAAGKRARAEFVLRNKRGETQDERTRDVLAEAIRRTAIEMPISKDDPTGRFARYNFPVNITLDDAVAVVLAPPAKDDALPIPN